MTRHGKIARCPKPIRDELNQRLDNGEPAVHLVEWLNSLPEVKQILDAYFEKRPINDNNVSEWKQGGFRDWQAHQEAHTFVQDSNLDATELAKPLATALLDQYATALSRSNADEAEDPRDTARRLGKSIREVVRVLRCGQSQQRAEIQRERARQHSEIQHERLALDRQWLELAKSKTENRKNGSPPHSSIASNPVRTGEDASAPDLESMSREEKSAYIKKIIYGD